MQIKSGEYKKRGDYHKKLDPNWSYYPTYLAKKKFILEALEKEPRDSKILDMGCGEGVFIEELFSRGFSNIEGIDLNYSSSLVKKGNILETSFSEKNFDIILLLDVIEHMSFQDQERLLKEIKRLLKDDGELIISIPNLAHFYSRISFLLKGFLKRTANIKKHPGDRPIGEYLQLLDNAGFQIEKRKGLFPTYPFFYNIIITFPAKTLWLYNFLNKTVAFPNFCFLNIFICNKKS
ncbi:MAG: class I SAM-dependent methyltransferase [Patescibacteria group bacterium]|nr:class I SAM-dependent methyltransferase [Patescibacteria group bacterium]